MATDNVSQWRRFMNEAFSLSIAQGDTQAPRRLVVGSVVGVALAVVLALSSVSTGGILIAAGIYSLAIVVTEIVLTYRRHRVREPRTFRRHS